MKILYIGMESANWVTNLCLELAELGHEITCITQTDDTYVVGEKVQVNPSLHITFVTFNELLDVVGFVDKNKELLQKDYDLVFGSHYPVGPLIARLGKELDLPWGVMLLDIPTDLIITEDWRKKFWAYNFSLLKNANAVVVNTGVAKDEYKRFTNTTLPDQNLITYGCNLPKQYKNSGLYIQGDYAVSACRLTSIKNCSLIPKALAKTNIKKYVAIGRDGGELDKIKQLCKDNNIEFEHHQDITDDEKFEIIKHSSVLIYPQSTKYIGGLSPFEGMFAGKPVIVSGLRVLIDLYGEHAKYFTNNDPDSLAGSINSLDVSKEQLLKASEYAEKTATFTPMAKSLIKVFESMLK